MSLSARREVSEPCSKEGCDCKHFKPSPWVKTKCRICFHDVSIHAVIAPERFRSGTFATMKESVLVVDDEAIPAVQVTRPAPPPPKHRPSVTTSPDIPPSPPQSAPPVQLSKSNSQNSQRTDSPARTVSKITRRAPPPPIPHARTEMTQSTEVHWAPGVRSVFDVGDNSIPPDDGHYVHHARFKTADAELEHLDEKEEKDEKEEGKLSALRAVARESSRKLFRLTQGYTHRSTSTRVFADLKETGHALFLGTFDFDTESLRFGAAKQCHQRRQRRDYVVDFKEGTLSNVTGKKGKKTWLCAQLYRLDKAYDDPLRLLLCLDHTSAETPYGRDYDLLFKTVAEREEFYLSVLTARQLAREKQDLKTFLRNTPPVPQFEQISISVSTWNLGNAPPEDLSWIPVDEYDMYVIGVQECQYPPRSTPINYTSCEVDFAHTMETHFGREYQVVTYESLWEIRLMVAVRKEHAHKVTCVEASSVGTGIANVLGNKGGVGMAMRFNETSLCFINAHLTAHLGNTQQRNENYADIIAGLSLGHAGLDANQFDHVFFFGDLNYRIELDESTLGLQPDSDLHNITHYHIVDCIRRHDYAILSPMDQLGIEMAKTRVLYGFTEGQSNFDPTYRYQRPRPASEPDYYSPERLPAWCDRILWQSAVRDDVKQLSLKSHANVLSSDHVPVSASFTVRTLQPFTRALFQYEPGVPIRKVRVVLLNVSGHGLGMESDDVEEESSSRQIRPYIEIMSPFINAFTPTKPLSRVRVGVVCQFGDLPPIMPLIGHSAYLRTIHLNIAVYSLSEAIRRHLGAGLIHLDSLSASSVVPFTSLLTNRGLPAGKLTGNIRLDVIGGV